MEQSEAEDRTINEARKARAFMVCIAFGRPDAGEDLNRFAAGATTKCDACNNLADRRVWWWQGTVERMNAWLCHDHAAALGGLPVVAIADRKRP